MEYLIGDYYDGNSSFFVIKFNMKKMKLKDKMKKDKKYFSWSGVVITAIIITTVVLLKYVSKNLTPKINDLIMFRVDRVINSAVVSIMDNTAFAENNFLDILKITKNKDEEIISVDYDSALSSRLIKKATKEINEVINNIDGKEQLVGLTDSEYVQYNGGNLIALVPIGMASDSVFLGNLGPKVPVKVSVMSNYYSTFESRIKEYGINTILIEIYLKMDISNAILLNFKETQVNKTYTVLVASKIVNGRIPEYYGNMITATSPLVTEEK